MRSFRTLLRRIPNMDTAAFAKWLAGVGLLDATQRGRAFRDLALAEVVDPIDDPTPCCEAEAAPALTVTDPVSAPAGEDLLSKVGRGRIGSFGCPHCGGDIRYAQTLLTHSYLLNH